MTNETRRKIYRGIGWLTDPVLGLLAQFGPADYQRPATLIQRAEAVCRQAVKHQVAQRGQSIAQGILDVLKEPSIWQQWEELASSAVRQSKEWAAADGRYSLLLKLIGEADSQVPLVSSLTLSTLSPAEHFRRLCEPADLLEQAARERGEVRARATVRALREIAEMLYHPYLRVLWCLTCFAREEWPTTPQRFGALVTGAEKRLHDGYPGLVDPDAGWLRNAAAHSHWQYLSNVDCVYLWDVNGRHGQFAVIELLSRVFRMYKISGPTLLHVSQLYMLRDVALRTGLLSAMREMSGDLLGSDEDKRIHAEQCLASRLEDIFKPLRSFISRTAPTFKSSPGTKSGSNR